MDKNYQVGRMMDMKDLSYVYGLLTDYRNRHSRYFFREYNDVFTFDNFSQYLEFNTEKEGLFELMNTLRSNDLKKRGINFVQVRNLHKVSAQCQCFSF